MPRSPGDRGWQPLFLPLGLAVVGLPHLDSTFPRGWWSLVVEVLCPGPSDSVAGGGGAVAHLLALYFSVGAVARGSVCLVLQAPPRRLESLTLSPPREMWARLATFTS